MEYWTTVGAGRSAWETVKAKAKEEGLILSMNYGWITAREEVLQSTNEKRFYPVANGGDGELYSRAETFEHALNNGGSYQFAKLMWTRDMVLQNARRTPNAPST